MFQVTFQNEQYDVQFRYGRKNFEWKYNPEDFNEKVKIKNCRYTECIISSMGDLLAHDDEGNPIYDDQILIIHQEPCSPLDNFNYDKGRKEALRKTLLQLFPGNKNKRIRYEFWMHYFASQIMSRLSTKKKPLHPREWRKVFV